MIYRVILSSRAEKQLMRLPSEVNARIRAQLKRIKHKPHSFVKKLEGSTHFSMRSGDYRVIMDVLRGELLILVIEIGHRRNVYK